MTILSGKTERDVREALVSRILCNLEKKHPVLLLVSGGSAAPLGVSVCQDIETACENASFPQVTVSLIDERFGPMGHDDSNWTLLKKHGFAPHRLTGVPVLTELCETESTFEKTTDAFNAFLSHSVSLKTTDNLYIVALFGIGTDGHTAGILPHSPPSLIPLSSPKFAAGFPSDVFKRITIAPPFFPHIDFAVVWASGSEKKIPLENLYRDIPGEKHPAQFLKLAKETLVVTNQDIKAHEKT
ncbi:MAG TPA: hypothetical protein GXZ47_03155 [Treponema sp.]|nr:hypothetical protein [Treponema sp.]